jgi:hypothetical protein
MKMRAETGRHKRHGTGHGGNITFEERFDTVLRAIKLVRNEALALRGELNQMLILLDSVEEDMTVFREMTASKKHTKLMTGTGFANSNSQ